MCQPSGKFHLWWDSCPPFCPNYRAGLWWEINIKHRSYIQCFSLPDKFLHPHCPSVLPLSSQDFAKPGIFWMSLTAWDIVKCQTLRATDERISSSRNNTIRVTMWKMRLRYTNLQWAQRNKWWQAVKSPCKLRLCMAQIQPISLLLLSPSCKILYK